MLEQEELAAVAEARVERHDFTHLRRVMLAHPAQYRVHIQCLLLLLLLLLLDL